MEVSAFSGDESLTSRNTAMQPLATSPGLRVLVADDHPDTGESLQILLSLWGHVVLVARSGQEALDSAQAFRPHVALLDFQMPGLNGGEVAQRLRQLPEFERLILVAATGHDQDEDSFKPYFHLFDYYLRKPFNLRHLEEILGCRSRTAEPGTSSNGIGT
jgi:CheY-like chemotaxis protein